HQRGERATADFTECCCSEPSDTSGGALGLVENVRILNDKSPACRLRTNYSLEDEPEGNRSGMLGMRGVNALASRGFQRAKQHIAAALAHVLQVMHRLFQHFARPGELGRTRVGRF